MHLRFFALLSLALSVVTPTAALAESKPTAVAQAAAPSALPRRFDIKPPARFRPSDTVLRLVDAGAATRGGRYSHHPHLYPRFLKDGNVVTMHAALLDGQDKHVAQHVLGFARSNGFTITAEGATPAQLDALEHALKPFGADQLVRR